MAEYISQITLPNNTTYDLKDAAALPKSGGILTGGLEVKGHIAGDNSTTTGHGLYSGGMYHNAYNNIILHGDATTGSSGIAFVSDKINTTTGAITNINAPSDRAFIQYHAYGVTTPAAEGTAPTVATSGEAGRLVIGIGNDSGDKIILQAPGTADIIHQMGANGYPIPHTTNTNGTVGGTTTPVYVDAGVIKALSYTIAKSVPSDAKFTDTTYSVASNGGLSLDGTAFSITSGGVTNTMLAGSIENGKLVNSSLTVGNKSISLGGSGTVHDILKTSINIGVDTSWDQYDPGVYYVASNAAFTGTNSPENTNTNNGIAPYRYGQLIVSRAGTGGVAQFYISHNDSNNVNYGIHYRTGWNNTYVAKWSVLLDSHNYTNYTVKKDGTGATGSWGISITGTATNVTGIVAIANGGTGASSFTPNQVIISNSSNGTATALTSRAYLHRSSHTPLSTTDSFVTEKTVYLGLPTINNIHNYDSDSTFFAPTEGGTVNQILISKGSTSAPNWTGDTATLAPLDGGYTLLTLGKASTAQGKIKLYSSGTTYTNILSQAGYDQTFYLPLYNGSMYAAHTENNNAVGSTKKPVYVATGGRITAINDTVGNPYIPTYLNGGEITKVYPIQYCEFKIRSGANTAILDHGAYNTQGEANNMEVIVLAIVVTVGESYLKSPITATIGSNPNDNTLGQITLSTTTVSGEVQGYIVTARGLDITPLPSSS